MSALYLALAIAFEIAGTLSLKLSEGFTRKRWIAPLVVSYVLAFVMLALVLGAGMPIGIAYGIWAAAGVALTAVLGRILFKEPLTTVMGAGIAAIVVGVLTIELGGH